MATILPYQRTVGSPGLGVQSQASGNDPVAQGLSNVGQGLEGLANGMNNYDAALRQRDERNQAAAAALALAKFNNDARDSHDEVARGIQDGTIPSDKAVSVFQERIGTLRTSSFQGLSPQQQANIADNVLTTSGGLTRNLNTALFQRSQSEQAGVIDQYIEQAQRSAARIGPKAASSKVADFLGFAGPQAGLSPEKIAKLSQQTSERFHYEAFQAAGVDALTKGDAARLADIRKQLQSPDGEPIDPSKRTVLTHQLFGYEQSILAKQQAAANGAEAAQRARENEAGDLYNKGLDLFQQGKTFDAPFIKTMTEAAAGTSHQASIVELLGAQAKGTGFATKSAAQRDAMLANADMVQSSSGPEMGTNPAQSKSVDILRTMSGKLKAQAAENPWAAWQSVGGVNNVQVLDAKDPSTALAVVRSRMAAIGGLENWTGKRESPLQPQEVEQVGKMIRSMPIEQAASMLARLGTEVGNAERVGSLAKQMHDKDGTLGLAMMYASAQTSEGRVTAELVLRGEQALKDKVVTVDGKNETGWKATIAKAVRGAYSNREAEDNLVDATFKIAAANYAKDGNADIERAVRLATGGIVERNGNKFPLPYGMQKDAFEKRIETLKPADIGVPADGQVLIGRTPMPVSEFLSTLPKASLVHAGQGLYNVRAGTGLVTNKDGTRITIKVTP